MELRTSVPKERKNKRLHKPAQNSIAGSCKRFHQASQAFYATDACFFFRTQNWNIAVITKRWFNTECE